MLNTANYIQNEKKCGVYLIVSPSGRKYIGSSVDIEKRWARYKKYDCKTQTLLFRSLMKYGIENHVFYILYECLPWERLEWERIFGELYLSLSDFGGLNLILPKTRDKPQIFSDATKYRMSNSLKIIYSENPEMKQRMSNRVKDFIINNPERYAEIKEILRISHTTPEYKKLRSEIAKKNSRTLKSRTRQSLLMKSRFNDPEERKKQSERIKKYQNIPEVKQKNRENGVRRFENENARKEAAIKTIEYFENNPEAAKKHSDFMKEYVSMNGANCSKKVVDTKTGKIFPTITAAAKSVRITRSTLSEKLNGRINNTSFVFLRTEKIAV